MARLSGVTAIEVIRVLEKKGFVFQRSRESHRLYRHPESGRRVTVSFHRGKSIPPGTLLNILREAGLTKEEFPELL
ncbi:MAG TPA: type II toxin-antitoxin system HicA family toxin [Anaerolineae bacterium]|nr:type II toxin-antitoxin system HicA family toxin [Anaerolineae bacterium]